MLNKIILHSLRNRSVVLVCSLLVMFAGIYTTLHTDVDVFPDLNAPTAVILTEARGLAPEEVERLVSFPIETAVNGAMNVRRVRSSSSAGFSVVWVEFDWGMDIYRARQIVSEKLSAVADALPSNVGTPVLAPQSSILGEIMIIGLTADSSSLYDLRTLADWSFRPRILSIEGVAQATVIGGEIKEYQIALDPARMKHYGVTLDEALAACRGMNQNAGGGVLVRYGNEYILRGLLSTSDMGEIGKSVVKANNNAPVLLEQFATVSAGGKSPKLGIASVQGKPAVLLTVTKQPHRSTLELTKRLDAILADICAGLPPDVHVSSHIFRQSDFIRSAIRNLHTCLLEGSLFVVVILFVFLMNVRTTLISLTALPLSLLVSVIVLHFMGITLNTMSLGGMAIAIGSLVDDAIVDVENVYRRLRENKALPAHEQRSSLDVVYDASREVRMPILISTLIIMVGFVPLFFLSGMEGRMLFPLGIAFIVALFASTVVALTLTPALCSFLPDRSAGAFQESVVARKLNAWYRTALLKALDNKIALLAATVALFALALALFCTLGRNFLPPFNEGSFTINISAPPGIALEESDKIGRLAEQALMEFPEIQTFARKTGRAELDEHALGINESELEAPFVLNKRSREDLTRDVRRRLARINGVNVEIGQPISHRLDAMLSGSQANIAIKIFGPDLNRLFAIGNRIREAIADVEGIADLNVEQQMERPQLTITPRRELLARYGISLPHLHEFLAVAFGGEVVGQVVENDKYFDLSLKIADSSRAAIDDYKNLMLDANGTKIPLSLVAEVVSTAGPHAINRENGQRKLVVAVNVAGRDLSGVVRDIRRQIDASVAPLPDGYRIAYGGQFESERQAGRVLAGASAMAILVIFLLLFRQFGDARVSGVILLNLPLALIGGALSLFFTGGKVSVPALIGFISLFGIATRNGLLLVSRYQHLIEQGRTHVEAVVQGSVDRLNPILMTAFTAALALIPLALRGSLPGNEIQSPMAVVILGGLLSSVLLNIFIIPAVYLLLPAER